MRPRALILDFGGVLVHAQDEGDVRRMAELLATSFDDFTRIYWDHRPLYDGGAPALDYWRVVLSACNKEATDELIAKLIDLDVKSWTHYHDEVWTIAAEFRKSGGMVSILSNGVPEIMSVVRRQKALGNLFDDVVISYEVGMQKPGAEIYRLALERLGVDAGEALFVDDMKRNTEPAAALGIQVLTFAEDRGASDLAKLLD